MSYRNAQVVQAPPWLQNGYGPSWSRAMGIVKDHFAFLARQAVKLRFPDVARSSGDAIAALGRERLLDQGVDTLTGANESLAAYTARVKGVWGASGTRGQPPAEGEWYWGGTAYGMLHALDLQGYGQAKLWQGNGRIWSLVSHAISWTDGPAANWLWNQFYVVFDSPPASWTSIVNPPTDISVPSLSEVNKLRRIINLWRAAHMLCRGILVITGGKIWGYPPSNLWGTGVWGGTTVVFDVPPALGLP
jgi:hypothetical protein